jgi:hypothetical protein
MQTLQKTIYPQEKYSSSGLLLFGRLSVSQKKSMAEEETAYRS